MKVGSIQVIKQCSFEVERALAYLKFIGLSGNKNQHKKHGTFVPGQPWLPSEALSQSLLLRKEGRNEGRKY